MIVGDQEILTKKEMVAAAFVGAMRQISSLSRNSKPGAEHPENKDWQDNIEGALGECAFAKLSDRYWGYSVDTFKSSGDVGDIEVRTNGFLGKTLFLLVRPSDKDEKKYVLMNGINGRYTYLGWMYGREAKQEEWFRTGGKKDTRPKCYWVPIKHLCATDPWD